MTGTKWFSGTDAKIFMTLHGKNGKSDELKLDDSFERGETDKLHFTLPNLGK